jgi:ankyrin repeat protein
VTCQFDILSTLRRPEAIREALRDLPQGLDATYDRMLLEIDPKYQKQVASTLKWLAFSLRPLRLEELAEIFILDHESDPPFQDDDRLLQSEDVLMYLPGMVTKDEDGYNPIKIRLAHFSIKEYLMSERIRQHRIERVRFFSTTELESHLHIAAACLSYHLQLSQTIVATEQDCRHFALWPYAAQAWSEHLESAPRESWSTTLIERVLQVLTAKSRGLLNMIRIQDPDDDNHRDNNDSLDNVISWPNWKETFDTLAPPLYYVVHDGVQLCSLLLDNGASVDELSPKGSESALYRAAYLGRESTVQLLLDRGASINIRGGHYGSPLQAAAYKSHERVVQLLLDRGADINITGGEYGTAIYAAVHTNQSIARLLLNRGADPTAPGGKFGNALQAAAYLDYKSMVRLMLDRGADINARGGFFGTALQAAAYGNADQSAIAGPSRDTIRFLHFLLNRGADINAYGGYFGNALQAAIAKDRYHVVKMLVSRGAELAPQEVHWNALIGGPYGERLRRFQKDSEEYLAAYEADAKLLSNGDDWTDDLVEVENAERFESRVNNWSSDADEEYDGPGGSGYEKFHLFRRSNNV